MRKYKKPEGGRGRPRKTYEEKKKNKAAYMLNKEWYCDICNNGKNYTLSGKWCHLKTKKHLKNMMSNFDDRDINLAMNGARRNDAAIVIKKK